MAQICYADMPGPTVMVEDGKRFPFYHHLQVGSVNGSIQYLCWQLYGDFRPKETHSSPNCPNVLLQAGGREPQPKGPQFSSDREAVRMCEQIYVLMGTFMSTVA